MLIDLQSNKARGDSCRKIFFPSPHLLQLFLVLSLPLFFKSDFDILIWSESKVLFSPPPKSNSLLIFLSLLIFSRNVPIGSHC